MAKIFLEYIYTVFLLNLNELRSLEEFTDEDTFFVMDDCPTNLGGEILSLLRDTRVRIIT
jgi:hypothetical protein